MKKVYLSFCYTEPVKQFAIGKTQVTILKGFNGLYYWKIEGEIEDNQSYEWGKYLIKESIESVLDYLSNIYDFNEKEKLNELI